MITKTTHKCQDGISAGHTASYYIDPNQTVHITRILRNMYSEPVTAVIRELVANAHDSHIQAKNTGTPIQIKLPSSLNPVFSVRDFGTGLSLEDFDRLILGFGSSGEHKRTSNEFVGSFGIGSKSVFSIADSFVYTVWHGGTKRKFLNFLDDTDMGQSKMLLEEPSDEPNGIEVSVPVKAELISNFHDAVPSAVGFLEAALEINPPHSTVLPKDRAVLVHSATGSQALCNNVALDWKLFKLPDTALKYTWQSTNVNATFKVVMGGFAYKVSDDKLTAMIVDKLPANTELVLYAPIGFFELSPTRETLTSTKKVLRELNQVVNDIITTHIDASIQPMLDAQSSPHAAAFALKRFKFEMDCKYVMPDRVTFQKKVHMLDTLFSIKRSEFTKLGCDIAFLGFERRSRRSKVRTKVYTALPSFPKSESQLMNIYREWYKDGEAGKTFRGMCPNEFTTLYGTAFEEKDSDVINMKGLLFDWEHKLSLITGTPKAGMAKFMTAGLQNGVQGPLRELVDARHPALWVRPLTDTSRPKMALALLYPWMIDIVEKNVDADKELWTAPAKSSSSPNAKVSLDGIEYKKMPAGIYQLAPSTASVNCHSDNWVKADLKERTGKELNVYVRLDKFQVDDFGLCFDPHQNSHSLVGYLRMLEIVAKTYLGEDILIYGVKAQETDRLEKSGLKWITTRDLMKKILVASLTAKGPLNLRSCVFNQLAIGEVDERRLGAVASSLKQGHVSAYERWKFSSLLHLLRFQSPTQATIRKLYPKMEQLITQLHAKAGAKQNSLVNLLSRSHSESMLTCVGEEQFDIEGRGVTVVLPNMQNRWNGRPLSKYADTLLPEVLEHFKAELDLLGELGPELLVCKHSDRIELDEAELKTDFKLDEMLDKLVANK